jgi:hypothetical protein
VKAFKTELPKPISDALHKEKVFTKALFERPDSLSQLLPYDEYIPESGVFRNKDGSLGAVFEATLLEHEPMSVDRIVSIVDSLKSWFTLPENCTLQVLFEQSYLSRLDPVFAQIENYYPTPHPVSKLLFERRLSEIKAACNTQSQLAPLVRRAFVSIRYYPEVGASSLKQYAHRSESVLFSEMSSFLRETRRFGQILAQFQSASQIELKKLSASDLLDTLRRFFNPKTFYKRSFAKYNPKLPLSDQILYNHPTLDCSGIEREGIKTRTLSLKTSPELAYPGGMAYFTQLPFPFRLSLNFSFPSKRKMKTFFDLKEFFLQNTPSAKARRQKKEILEIQERLAHGDRALHATMNVVIEGESDDELDSRVRDVVNVFQHKLECEAIVEEDIGLGLCLNTLPMVYTPKSDPSTQRFIRVMRDDVVKFIPIFDSFRGTKKPLGVYLSRENNLVPFSFLENETSNHSVILGDSGSGKSAWMIELCQCAKRMSPEVLIFVVDRKSTCHMLSEYFDGEMTVYDRNKDMPSNAFRGRYDEEKIAFLTGLLSTGIRLTSPNFQMESLHETAISKALRVAYEKKLKQAGLAYVAGELLKQSVTEEVELTVEDIIVELSALPSEKGFEAFGKIVDELTQYLMPFYGQGNYAKFFRGSTQKKRSAKSLLYVYDLDSLDTDPVLQALMTMTVFEEIRQIKKLPENEVRTAMMIFEEVGMLGRNNPVAAPFVINYAETARKLNLWLKFLSPRPANFFELEVGRAAWGVSDNFYFLQMSADNVKYLKEHSDLIGEPEAQIIESVRTVNGEFAEVYYFNKKKTWNGVIRFAQTALDRWLTPNNAKDLREALKARKQFSGQRWKALEYLAEKFPKGVARFEESINEERMKTYEGS